MAEKPWGQMTVDEKLEALRKDIADIANFVNPLARDLRDLNTRVNAVAAELDASHKKEVPE